MVEVFLCCSPADREVAGAIAARLEAAAEARVIIDDTDSGTVAEKWEGGLAAAGVLLLLSPDSVPKQVNRDAWGDLLDHAANHAEPPVGTVLVRPCGYPRILDRKLCFRWDSGSSEVLRAIHQWVISLHQLPDRRTFVPARLPWFEGRDAELALLWETLVDGAGSAALVHAGPAGKTSLAQEFARRAAAHFRDVLWVRCAGRTLAAIVAQLAEQIGAGYPGETDEVFADLLERAGKHRVLLVFDDLPEGVTLPARHGRASVLVTTHGAGRNAPAGARLLPLSPVPAGDVTIPDNPVDLRLWRAMAVCRPDGFPLELATGIAGLEASTSEEAYRRLVAGRWVDPLDEANGWMRLNAASLAAAKDLAAERRRHAELVDRAAAGWAEKPEFRERYEGEWLAAFRWAAVADWRLALRLARNAVAFLRQQGRLAETATLLVALREAADQHGEWQVSDECSWELSWIRGLPYRGAGWAPVDGDQLGFDFGAA